MSGRPIFSKCIWCIRRTMGRRQHLGQRTEWGCIQPWCRALWQAAHAAGLQLTAHVETAEDFRHAVRAGVDELAHVPGWLLQGPDDAKHARLTEDDARLAAEQGSNGHHDGWLGRPCRLSAGMTSMGTMPAMGRAGRAARVIVR